MPRNRTVLTTQNFLKHTWQGLLLCLWPPAPFPSWSYLWVYRRQAPLPHSPPQCGGWNPSLRPLLLFICIPTPGALHPLTLMVLPHTAAKSPLLSFQPRLLFPKKTTEHCEHGSYPARTGNSCLRSDSPSSLCYFPSCSYASKLDGITKLQNPGSKLGGLFWSTPFSPCSTRHQVSLILPPKSLPHPIPHCLS